MKDVVKNPVLFDLLQVNVTPDYLISRNEKYEKYKDLIIANCISINY